jgi:predicted TIM-barrel fold metal-dependent hydrolase
MTTVPPNSLVACLESYINPALPVGTLLSKDTTAPALHLIPAPTLAKLRNLGPSRVKDMRSLGHTKQILSHIPIEANASTCAKFNNALYASIQLNTDKFAALAMLPTEGKEAAKELQRCVTKMKFVGGVVASRSGASLHEGFEELWDTAEKYRVPIAVRELWPTGDEV